MAAFGVKKGFINPGTHCFANASMQLLFSSKNFCNWLQQKAFNHPENCKTSSIDCVLCQLLKLYVNFSYSDVDLVVEPLLKALKKTDWKDLDVNRDQCAKEFLHYVINHLKDHHGLSDFQMDIAPLIVCSSCLEMSPVADIRTEVSLAVAIHGKPSLLFAISSKMNPDQIPEDKVCIKCEQETSHTVQEKMSAVPKVLVLTVENDWDPVRNAYRTYHVPATISLKPHCIQNCSDRARVYHLKSLIYHVNLDQHQLNRDKGHYYAVCKQRDGSFFSFDDQQVKAMETKSIFSSAPTVALYEGMDAGKSTNVAESESMIDVTSVCDSSKITDEHMSYNTESQTEHSPKSVSTTLGHEGVFRNLSLRKRDHDGKLIDHSRCSKNSDQHQTLKSLELNREALIKIGENIANPKKQNVLFIPYEHYKEFYELEGHPFPYESYRYVDADILLGENGAEAFVLDEFKSLDFPLYGSEEFFSRRTNYLVELSLKLLGGVYITIKEHHKEVSEYIRFIISKKINPDMSHCKLCKMSFLNFAGTYLHLIRNHTPLHLLMMEELVFLGVGSFNHKTFITWNEKLSVVTRLLTTALIRKFRIHKVIDVKRDKGNGSFFNTNLDNWTKILIQRLGKDPELLLNIPDHLRHHIDPMKWKFDLERYSPKMKTILFENIAKTLKCYFDMRRAKNISLHKVYIIALIDKGTRKLVETKFNSNLTGLLTTTENVKLSSPIVIYAGKCANQSSYSPYHFRTDIRRGSTVAFYWQTAQYTPYLLSSELVHYNPDCGMSAEDFLCMMELKRIFLLKAWCAKHFIQGNIKLVAPQIISARDSSKWLSNDWIRDCLNFCETSDDLFAFDPVNEFEIKLSHYHRIKPSARPRLIKNTVESCISCGLFLPTTGYKSTHKHMHKKKCRVKIMKGKTNLRNLLDSVMYMSCTSNDSITNAIARIIRITPTTKRIPGLYLVAVDMYSTTSMEPEELHRELIYFFKNGTDSVNRPNRFLLYIGRNQEGAKPSKYHMLTQSLYSSLKKINRPTYFIKGWKDQGEQEDFCFLILFLKKCLQKMDHISFINTYWTNASNGQRYDQDFIVQMCSEISKHHQFFCTNMDCAKDHQNEHIFSNIHLDPADFRDLQMFDNKRKPTSLEDLKMKGYLNNLNNNNFLDATEQSVSELKLVEQYGKVPPTEFVDQQYHYLRQLFNMCAGRNVLIIWKEKNQDFNVKHLKAPYNIPSFIVKVEPLTKQEDKIWCTYCETYFSSNPETYLHLPKCVANHFQQAIFYALTYFPTEINWQKNFTFYPGSNHAILSCKFCHLFFQNSSEAHGHLVKRHRELTKNQKICIFCKSISDWNTSKHDVEDHFARYRIRNNLKVTETMKSWKKLVKKDLEEHQTYRPLVYTCNICSETFRYESDLDNHEIVSHNKQDTCKCPWSWCGKVFSSRRHKHNHLKICRKAKKVEMGVVKNNLEKKKKSRPLSHTCKSCSETFRYDSDLDNHEIVHHNKLGVWQCRWTWCNKVFSTRQFRRKHSEVCRKIKKLEISGVKFDLKPGASSLSLRHACSICFQAFRYDSDLDNHEIVNHKKQGICQCIFCAKFFSSRRYKANHLNLCRKTRKTENLLTKGGMEKLVKPTILPHACSNCSSKFKCESDLDNHEIIDHNKPGSFCCRLCEKIFSSQRHKYNHLRICRRKKQSIMSGVKIDSRDWAHKCSICSKTFRYMSDLDNHEITDHDKPGSFRCTRCDKVFSLQKHKQNHSNVCRKTKNLA